MNFKENIFGFDEEFKDSSLCNAWVATAIVGAAVVGAGASIYGANKASEAQTNAANTAAATSKAMYDTTRADLAPFRDIGATAGTDLKARLSDLTAPISVNPDDFKNSDMYKFLETQGQRGVTNSAAARGLGKSGAALKGAATFETGLNTTQWQQNFNNQVTNQTNAYNRLKGLVDTGENAAAQTGVQGTAAAGQIGNAVIGAGNAQAAGYNATGSAISGAANSAGGYAAYKGIYGSPSGGVNSDGSIAGAVGPTSVGGAPLVY